VRLDHFEALAPICPRCLHHSAITAPLVIGERAVMRAGRLWHGLLHCSNRDCWMEFPVIDGVPVLTPDPAATLRSAEAAILTRDDLPEGVESLIGDALGPGAPYDIARQHLSIYAGDHYADWSEPPGASSMAATMRSALDAAPAVPDGPALDIGSGPGRGGWEIAATGRMAVSADLNLGFLRIAQRLALDGQASYPARRIGLVYDRRTVTLPPEAAAAPVDFWALDATALPFPAGHFALATAINVVDCVPSPTSVIEEIARVTRPGGAAVFTTPYDWSSAVPEIVGWLGGHSQRAPHAGAGEPVLTATLKRAGLTPVAEAADLPWDLRLHARSVMHYTLHLVACTRADDQT
jgi:SAM-dependent methyltransferase/uncharacterized protein YbaR (Trm112 family)